MTDAVSDATKEARMQAWTETLYAAQRDHVQVPAPSSTHGDLSLHDALEVQARVARRRVEAGERQVGWKVGATSFAVLEQMKGMIDSPMYGRMMSGTTWSDPEHMKRSDFFSVGLEAEIGIVLEKSLRGPGITNKDVLNAASGVIACVEFVDGRILEGGGLANGAADNAAHGGSVLGTLMKPARGFDFVHEGGIMRRNGKVFASACGVEALGNPLSVVSWLANELAKHDDEIEAGHVVSTGSLHAIMPADAGDTIEVSFANLGRVGFTIVE
jgi:2-oxopent-4-enoate/cis-2-oxohex-4-enoate hydratase